MASDHPTCSSPLHPSPPLLLPSIPPLPNALDPRSVSCTSPSSGIPPMATADVLQVKHLADQHLGNGPGAALPQSQPLRALISRLVHHALSLEEARCAGLLSSKRKIDTLNDYIHSLTLTKQSSTSRLELQSTEIDLLKRQAIALSNKMSAPSPLSCRHLPPPSPLAATQRRTEENYDDLAPLPSPIAHRQALESQNRLLLLEKKALEQKLVHAEAQVLRLSTEFKKLRSLLITGRPDGSPLHIARDQVLGLSKNLTATYLTSDPVAMPTRGATRHPGVPRTVSPTPQHSTRSLPPKHRPTIGDADAEHLLLASERLTSASRARKFSGPSLALTHPSPSIKLAFQRSVGSLLPKRAVSSPSQSGRRMSEPALIRTADSSLPSDPPSKDNPTLAASALPKGPLQLEDDEEDKDLAELIVPNRLIFSRQVQQPNQDSKASPSNQENRVGLMDDLLAAAETVLNRVSSPGPHSSSPGLAQDARPTRPKKPKSHHPNQGASLACFNSLRTEVNSATAMTGLVKYSSGLDVLADQAFASQIRSAAATELTPGTLSSSSLSSCSIHHTSVPPSPHMSYSSDLSDIAPEDGAPAIDPSNDFKLGSSPPQPSPIRRGLKAETDKPSQKTKKIRSLYVKWDSREDELLVEAVSKYGHRWDVVSKCVPSRSYHQCRQRWLRGLKGGNNLPQELRHYSPAIQASMKACQLTRRQCPSPRQCCEGLEAEDGLGSAPSKSPSIGSADDAGPIVDRFKSEASGGTEQ